MSNAAIWPGSSSFLPGDTPMGYYDFDAQFPQDAERSADYCATRLGYPTTNIELEQKHFFTAFENAVTMYGNEVYAYKLRQDYLSIEGSPTSSYLNDVLVTPNFASVVRISQQYGEEAGVGGTITYYSGSLNLTSGRQAYNLNEWAINDLGISATDRIEVKRVFYEAPPAIVRYFDPYAGTGTGMMQMLDSFGWGNYSPAINFMMMPLNYDVQKLQAIELNDQIRKSQFSFEIVNNRLRIFPIPGTPQGRGSNAGKLWIEYIKTSERNNPFTLDANGNPIVGSTTNVSNAPYTNPTYSKINSIGRAWIFEYAVALSKEMLGMNRGKYTTIPIPGDAVTMNASDLLSQAKSERESLMERLRAYLDDLSREKLLERRAAESDNRMKELQQVPFLIYIG